MALYGIYGINIIDQISAEIDNKNTLLAYSWTYLKL